MQEIQTQIKQAIKNLYNIDFDVEVSPAPENVDADYSSNAPLKLAKELHKPPMQIAEELGVGTPSAPGFINFTFSDESLNEALNSFSLAPKDTFAGKTVICEFSDPNPFKILHVGHLYTSIVGDSISRLFEYAGANVVRANFGGDVGLHVAKTMYILLKKDTTNLTIEDIAKCYVEGTAAYEDDETAKAEITALNKEIYKINAEDIHGTELADLYWRGRELSYDYFKDFYASVGVKFDKYYPESTVAALGLKTVKEQLGKGVYEMSDGAVIFDGDKFGLHTRVFINKEGVPTYEAKDVGLIFTKYNDFHFDKSVVITGNEQLEYMKVVLKSVEQYAPELVKKTSHLTHGLVRLPGNEKMSSRKGNFLKAVDVMNMVKDELKNGYNSDDDKVAVAAAKYAFLKYRIGGNIIFDPKESVKMTGNSGPYLLYSAVRAKKVLANCVENSLKANIALAPRDANGQRPTNGELQASEPHNDGRERSGLRETVLTQYEKNLIKKILEYKTVLDDAVAEMAPHKVANYLYELAQEFSRFYENCPVAGSAEEAFRVKLVKTYLDTITHGLNILGIEVPEEM